MHVPIKVKSHNNISEWQKGFNSAFKGLIRHMNLAIQPCPLIYLLKNLEKHKQILMFIKCVKLFMKNITAVTVYDYFNVVLKELCLV